MSLNSVNTNVGAMIALQSLNDINQKLTVVQTRISTGLKVSSAKDDGATWAIAQRERSDVSALDAVKSSLQRGQSIADVSSAAGETISDLISQMKEKAVAASDPSLTAADKAALNADYVSLRKQIDTTANNADFDGVSLVSAGSTGQVRSLANGNGTATIDINHVDLSTTGAALSGMPVDLTGTIGATEITAMNTALDNVDAAVASLGTGSKALDTHLTFIGKLQDTMTESIGRLVDADVAEESANLQALQVRQQLAIQALSIANQTPSLLLMLFQRN